MKIDEAIMWIRTRKTNAKEEIFRDNSLALETRGVGCSQHGMAVLSLVEVREVKTREGECSRSCAS